MVGCLAPLSLGVEASDDTDGDISSKVSIAHVPSRLSTKSPTKELQPFWIVYTVADAAGNPAAEIARQIHVRCPDGESLCPPNEDDDKLVCSPEPSLCGFAHFKDEDGATEGEPPGAPPTLLLVGPGEVEVKAGQPYTRCSPTTPPSVVCERGAVAHDDIDGDLTDAVEVRPHPPPSTFLAVLHWFPNRAVISKLIAIRACHRCAPKLRTEARGLFFRTPGWCPAASTQMFLVSTTSPSRSALPCEVKGP